MNFTTYELVGALVIGATMIVAFIKPIMELQKVLTSLDSTLQNLDKFVTDMNIKNDREHNELYDNNIKLLERLVKLETEHSIKHE